jgi:hypothetical protein
MQRFYLNFKLYNGLNVETFYIIQVCFSSNALNNKNNLQILIF